MGEEMTIQRDDLLRQPVEMHRVDLEALVHVSDQDLLSLLDHDRLGCRKALAVQRGAQRSIVQDHRVIDGRGRLVRVVDDERAQQPHRYLLLRHEVAVVHVRAHVSHREGVRE